MTNADMLSMYGIDPIEYQVYFCVDHLDIDDKHEMITPIIEHFLSKESTKESVDEWINKRHGSCKVDCEKLIFYIDKLEKALRGEYCLLDFPELWRSERKNSVYSFKLSLYSIINIFHVYRFLYFDSNGYAYIENEENLIEVNKATKELIFHNELCFFEKKPIDSSVCERIINEYAYPPDQILSHIHRYFRINDGKLEEYNVADSLYDALVFQLLRLVSLGQKGIFTSIGICANSACRSVFEMEHGNQRYCPKCRQGKNFDAMRKAECRKRKKARDAQNAAKE